MQESLLSKEFKTQTIYKTMENIKGEGLWTIALDIGYSAVKGMSPNAAFSFPSFAKEFNGTMVGSNKFSDIFYRGEDGKQWIVGNLANTAIKIDDTTDSISTLYERRRYYTPMYKVLARVGLALGSSDNNQHGNVSEGDEYFVQTGLPPAYLAEDTEALIDVFEGRHKFSIKIGKSKWNDYDITIDRKNIGVIAQPMGAVISASKKDDGTTVYGLNGDPLVEDNILVVDGGFGTLDVISIINKVVEASLNTFSDVGMKAVFSTLSDRLMEEHGKQVAVHALQPTLDKGFVVKIDRKTMQDMRIPITDMLEEISRTICRKAFDRINSSYNFLADYRYLLLAGGTCDAWKQYIKEMYAGLSELEIVFADRNDKLGPVFSNVRGYYHARLGMRREPKKAKEGDAVTAQAETQAASQQEDYGREVNAPNT
jgi:plasmid segregation protein ParM